MMRWLLERMFAPLGFVVVTREQWSSARLALDLLDESWAGDDIACTYLYHEQGVNQAHRHLGYAVRPTGECIPTRPVYIDTESPF